MRVGGVVGRCTLFGSRRQGGGLGRVQPRGACSLVALLSIIAGLSDTGADSVNTTTTTALSAGASIAPNSGLPGPLIRLEVSSSLAVTTVKARDLEAGSGGGVQFQYLRQGQEIVCSVSMPIRLSCELAD